jgi:pilus assembly protein Flp/PilA
MDGQGIVEYALILVLVAIIVIAVLTTMGPQLSAAFRDVVTEVSRTRS